MSETDRSAIREEILKLINQGYEDRDISRQVGVPSYVLVGIIRDLTTTSVVS